MAESRNFGGRPRKDGPKRDRCITVWMTQEEYDSCLKLQSEAGVSMSEWARALIFWNDKDGAK